MEAKSIVSASKAAVLSDDASERDNEPIPLFENLHQKRRLLSTQQLAEMLSVHPQAVYRLVRDGEIPGLRLKGSWRFIWEDVLAALKQRSSYGNKGS